jgi:hypothetical protein
MKPDIEPPPPGSRRAATSPPAQPSLSKALPTLRLRIRARNPDSSLLTTTARCRAMAGHARPSLNRVCAGTTVTRGDQPRDHRPAGGLDRGEHGHASGALRRHARLTTPEFFQDRRVPYFTGDVKAYTDLPFLVTLRERGDGYVPGRFLTARTLGRSATAPPINPSS